MSTPKGEHPLTQLQHENETIPPGAVESPDLTGTVLLGRYRLLAKLGAGGMGTVYLGAHTSIGKKFAIKVLGNEFVHRPDLVQRFLREAQAASMISQPNVVEISDFGDTPDGSVFFVMEYLDGEDLGMLVRREKRVPWSRVRHLVVQVCRALEAAHAAGIIHRDMKPDNCFRISRQGDPDFIKVIDFGIAKVESGDTAGKGLTQTGMIFGTPEYMSPEQAQGDKIDHRADIYAVGVIMYQLLCGRQPFTGSSFMAVLTKHMFDTPQAPTEVAPEAEIPPEAEAIVLKAMQKDRAYRFQSMSELIAAIERVGTGAAAVQVVHESIARPEGGPTNFARRAAATATSPQLEPGGMAPLTKGLRMGLGLGGLVAAAAIAYLVFGPHTRAEPKPPEAVPQQQPATTPAPAAAGTEPAPVVTPPDQAAPAVVAQATGVTLHFDTNVPAQILDARDRAIYGLTEDDAGIGFPLSEQGVALILHAEGYEDLAIEVVPNRERKDYRFELRKLGSKSGKPRGSSTSATSPSSSSSTSSTSPSGEPIDEPKPAGPTLPGEGQHDGEIKNPFGK
jgi:eukaryotic-like serine/threonine-protein kinase